jgi:glycosyltransferase involved in cell wall biosynthesis
MKILQISNSHDLRDGGAQRLAVEFHRAFLERGHDAHLLSLMRSPTRDLPHLYSLGLRTPYHTRVLPRLLDALRQPRWRDVDIVHVHLFPAQVLAPLALQVLGRRAPLVTTEHNTFNRRRATSAGRAFDAAYYKSYKRIIAISEGTRDEMARWLPQLRPKLHVITNGIDLSAFPSTCPEQVLERPGEAPLILSMGRISPQKNYPAALRAVARLRD